MSQFNPIALFVSLTIGLCTSSTGLAADYRLPFEGRWFVMAGGDTINVNHHMTERSQWFGVDFMKVGGVSQRAVTKGAGQTLEDYYSWNEPVLSPVAGVVRKVHDGDRDNPIGQTDKRNAFGNHVVIEASPNEFVYLAHFKQGSLLVKEGERVTAGQKLGHCGNSGNTSGPHLHLHVQDQLAPYTGTGRNITFQGIDVLLSGKQFDNVNWPLLQGLFVAPRKDN